MSTPFIGEIRIFPYNFAVNGWAECNGQLISIAQNSTLFALIGTTYGGDGVNTYGLPDLRGRAALHQGQGPGLSPYTIGQSGGVDSVTLTTGQMGVHNHLAGADANAGNQRGPFDPLTNAANVWAGSNHNQYSNAAPTIPLSPAAVGPAGGNQPHNNVAPQLVLNFQIALFGVFPSRN